MKVSFPNSQKEKGLRKSPRSRKTNGIPSIKNELFTQGTYGAQNLRRYGKGSTAQSKIMGFFFYCGPVYEGTIAIFGMLMDLSLFKQCFDILLKFSLVSCQYACAIDIFKKLKMAKCSHSPILKAQNSHMDTFVHG